ncbi:hypothetical protein [Paenibacillus alvei]|uniref:hypothetical protein n=1 Tax=Paenibacillus alvei TaxID=44250 RepID=UPI0018CEBC48|nr:hypothetical protein [Paenibacillus alvei]MBG9737836.1 hypothetical protein [Paenibacillus alvei]MBG9747528.1 hypothetical protein [Paenibacillus alvei]MCY9580934.1 hypothetical protein [Paenibacillus alvei]MCY9585652.1 hypothetical protein [Paenibacillus alvei]
MAKRVKNLNYELITQMNEKFNEMKKVVVTIDIGDKAQQFGLEICKYFSPAKMDSCITELIDKLDQAKLQDKEKYEQIIVPYLMFLTVKHFTTLELPSTFSEQLQAIETMINTGTLFQIYMSFEEKELERLSSTLRSAIDTFHANAKEFEELKEKMKTQLADKSLME